MYRYLKTLLIMFLLVGGPGLYPTAFAWQEQQKQQQPESEAETKELPSQSDEQTSDEPTSDEDYTNDGTYTDEEKTAPFPEIISPPERVERKVDNSQWSKLTKDKDFEYEEPTEPKPKASNGDNWFSRMFLNLFQFLASGVGNVIIIAIVALIIILIVVRIVQLKGNIFFSKKDKKLSAEQTDELSDEYLPDDWEKVIQDAARAGNYRLAVRHGYRYLLSLLQENGLINYQVAKTNYQYVFELAGTPLHKPFMQLTRDYEYAWYGGFNIQQERFEAYYEKVSSIKKELNQ
jgi:cytoskeletal protein RodZ